MKTHNYKATIEWTGNKGTGTDNYKNYERDHTISIEHKSTILGSSDPAFRGDKTRHNPEDMFVSSLSSCHMLWYLHFCSVNNIIVEEYTDTVTGIMTEEKDGKGYFTEVTLNPKVVVSDVSMIERAIELHHEANKYCFIANSVNFSVKHNPIVVVKE
ncbi:OsmC family protein [Myroides marinus]|uniref:OsmC family protein n=1 Tax=Myroides marinus TaxID=703342 RepID=UPI002574AF43|nr:OsmC family protein [Myroides marinus]MDM1501956.1 OsmC family protein [Myroides marinus]